MENEARLRQQQKAAADAELKRQQELSEKQLQETQRYETVIA